MNTEPQPPLAAEHAPATPAQAGTFSLASLLLRVLPTVKMLPFNFAPVGGLAVFTGAKVRTWLAYALPLAVMIATDMILWTIKGDDYSPLHLSRPLVYGSFLVYVLLGRCLGRNLVGIGAAAGLGSVQFYLITNFGSWLDYPHLYSRTLDGLLESYVAGLPFFRYTLLSDMSFALAFVGIHFAWVRATTPAVAGEVSQS